MAFAQRFNQSGELRPRAYNSSAKQRRQMLAALAMLLSAMILVVAKERSFWLSTLFSPKSTTAEQSATAPIASKTSKRHRSSRFSAGNSRTAVVADSGSVPTISLENSDRVPITPLQVEVVAASGRRLVEARPSSIHLDLRQESPAGARNDSAIVPDSSEKVRLSRETLEVVSNPVEPHYPQLAKEMKVEGSVVLQASISKDGKVQALQVLSGPEILAEAAREAVRQWQFKPYYQRGKPVETQTRVTVNFTIFAH